VETLSAHGNVHIAKEPIATIACLTALPTSASIGALPILAKTKESNQKVAECATMDVIQSKVELKL